MSAVNGPSTVDNGRQIYLDANNIKSSAAAWTDLVSRARYSTSTYLYPTFASANNIEYFNFINDGVTRNVIGPLYNVPPTRTQTQYTRMAWFYLTGYNNSDTWPRSPIISNESGNNNDMALMVAGHPQPLANKLAFHQYARSTDGGATVTNYSDYTITGTIPLELNTWYHGAVTVDRIALQVSLYVNGVLDRTAALNSTIGPASYNSIMIGGCSNDGYSGQRMFKGRIASVAHYNRVLTANEVFQNFSAHRGRYGV
jgi:hypothetical protein